MNTAKQAERILEAWNSVDCCRFEAELERTSTLCETDKPISELENEQRAVLQSVVQHFRQASQKSHQTSVLPQWEAGLFLLRHLQNRAA